jgi:lactate dehydrogenase-like 2-hydroxyacid dehydrogenase
MTNHPAPQKIAIYDCPRIVSSSIARELERHGHSVIFDGHLFEKERTPAKINAAPEADIWITKWTLGLNSSFLREFHPKKGIITISSGTGHIDSETLKSFGLELSNCPTFGSNSVAEHAMALAFRSLYDSAVLPPLSVRQVIFSHFSDEYAEQAVAQILMRTRQINDSMERAERYDYVGKDGRRHDEPWSNEELSSAKIGIIGRDRSAVKLARILRDGFGCSIYGFDASESLAFYNIEQKFIMEILEQCDYVFMCTDRFGFMIPPDEAGKSLEMGRVDSRLLPRPDMSISDSNVAILGTGGIGSVIARIALKGFKCSVTAYSRSEKQNLSGEGVVYHLPQKDERALQKAIERANFIFISAKLPKGTPPLLDGDVFGSLPVYGPRVIVNVARDDMVASEPLYQFISNGSITYATDVLPNDVILWSGGEPDDTTRKFVQHSRVMATPHEGDCSRGSLQRLVDEVTEKLKVICGG